MKFMITVEINENDGGQRLDRFLRKFLPGAPLSRIYKIIRKDAKVNGRRIGAEALLAPGDVLDLYLSEEELSALRGVPRESKALRQFAIAYEDERLLAVSKPFGLLTHGDGNEKKNTLANQVLGYLIQKGDYNPRAEKTFVPAPANRLDRNTTGLVLFGKDAATLKDLNRRFREREGIGKFYLTIVAGNLPGPVTLTGRIRKDTRDNVSALAEDDEDARAIECRVRPLRHAPGGAQGPGAKSPKTAGFTLVEVELLTGRSHQIRVQLAGAGHPIIGDVKYGDPRINRMVRDRFSLTTQLLHAYRVVIDGLEIQAEPPAEFQRITGELFHDKKTGRRPSLENQK
jgi:23S rRNA pseudouridine955/2504/2580 synthase